MAVSGAGAGAEAETFSPVGGGVTDALEGGVALALAFAGAALDDEIMAAEDEDEDEDEVTAEGIEQANQRTNGRTNGKKIRNQTKLTVFVSDRRRPDAMRFLLSDQR